MRLIFIRHGDPDYANDNVTEKGKREVELLTKRICGWFEDEKKLSKTDFFTSPMGRAKATGQPAMEKLGRSAKELFWLQEFYYPTKYPENYPVKELRGKDARTWDLMPELYTSEKDFFDKDKWAGTDYMKGGKIRHHYKEVCDGIDGLLKEYGYIRNKSGFYDVKNPVPNHNWDRSVEKYHLTPVKTDYPEEQTLVFFCHLGIMFAVIAHLTGFSPMQLWQGFYVAPTSITVLNSEERLPGQAWFRVERLGDTCHLIKGGEPISSSGYFADVLRENP